MSTSTVYRTFGPSLIRMEGMSRRGIDVVFHQFGAPKRAIFSSVDSFWTRSGIEASRNERDDMAADPPLRVETALMSFAIEQDHGALSPRRSYMMVHVRKWGGY